MREAEDFKPAFVEAQRALDLMVRIRNASRSSTTNGWASTGCWRRSKIGAWAPLPADAGPAGRLRPWPAARRY